MQRASQRLVRARLIANQPAWSIFETSSTIAGSQLDSMAHCKYMEVRMKRTLQLLLIVTAFAGFGGTAQADTLTFTTTLSGVNAVLPNLSPGVGDATVIFDTLAHTLTVNVTFSGLLSPTAAAHIHCCDGFGVNAAMVAVPFPGFPNGVTSGNYSNIFNLTDPTSFNAGFITAAGGTPAQAEALLLAGMLAGNSYIDIHTIPLFPAGEIRGQLAAPVPEPTTLVLLGSGLAGLALRKRHKLQN
jgi:hypothetical protein